MRSIFLGITAILILSPGWGWAADAPLSEPAPSPAPKESGHPASQPASASTLDELPWNPDLHHANVWPYEKPAHVDSDYFGPPGEFWLRAEYFLWCLKGERLPPLVTSGPAGSAGVLGTPGVGTLFGGSTQDLNPFGGGRFTGGVWFDTTYTLGFAGTYFFLPERANRFATTSLGQPGSADLARPFVNALTGQPASLLIASAGLASGTVTVRSATDLQGAEAMVVCNLCRQPSYSFNLMAGFRYLDLGGELTIGDGTTSLAGAPVPGNQTITVDQFAVRNHFYGGQIGGRVEYRWHGLAFDLIEKLALGANTTDIVIGGGTMQTTATGTVTQTAAGLLAQPSNTGKHADDTFAVLNEISIQAGWQCNDYVQFFVGYSFLYTSSVIRPADLVDLSVNLAQGVAGPARPAFAPRNTDFWAHGLNAGLEIRY